MILTTNLSAARNLAMVNLITNSARERISVAVRLLSLHELVQVAQPLFLSS